MEDLTLAGVFVASLLGSTHCAGMCGGFVTLYSTSSQSSLSHALYNAGRLCTYLLLGSFAGYLGGKADLVGHTAGIHRLGLGLLSITLIAWGVLLLLPKVKKHLDRSTALQKLRGVSWPFKQTLLLGHKRLGKSFPFFLGATTTLLPCGWLYVFLGVAAAQASAAKALVVMTIFWFGTLPVLLTLGGLSQRIGPRAERWSPSFSAIIILASGVISLYFHLQVNLEGVHARTHSCHEIGEDES